MPKSSPRRAVLALLAVLAAPSAFAQPATAPAAPPAPAPNPRVALTTPEGVIVIELALDKAPVTAANFLRYVDQKRFDGVTFYRANTAPGHPAYGMLQGGVDADPKRVLKPIGHEPTTQTGLSHKDGAISMGRFAPGTAAGDFFICSGDLSESLDANPKASPPSLGYAVFGRVVEGMEVVRKILATPVDPTAGEGVMKGTMLARRVPIVTARRVG